jgi:adenylyltransferase/sulfurtransferase
LYDALEAEFREVKVRKNPHCPVCSPNPTVTQLIDYDQFCGIPHTAPVAANGVGQPVFAG